MPKSDVIELFIRVTNHFIIHFIIFTLSFIITIYPGMRNSPIFSRLLRHSSSRYMLTISWY